LLTIDDLGQNPGAGGFSNAPGPAKKKSMGELIAAKRIFQGEGNMLLPNDIGK
jgi:hypothetical protein